MLMYFQIRRQLIYYPKLNIGTELRKSSLLVCNSHRNLQEQYGHVPPHWAETMQISSHHPEQTFSTRGRSTLAQYLPSPQWPSCIQNVYFLNVRNHFRIHLNFLCPKNAIHKISFTWVQLVHRPLEQRFKHSSLRTHTDPSGNNVLHCPLSNPKAVIPEQYSLKPHSLSAPHPLSLFFKYNLRQWRNHTHQL